MKIFSLASLSIAIATAAVGDDGVAKWRDVDASTGRISDATELGRLANDFPHSASVELRRLSQRSEAGDANGVRASLARLADMGYSLSPTGIEQLSQYFSADEVESLSRRFEYNRRTVAASDVHAVIPQQFRLIEGVAWDARNQRLFASSVVDRALLVKEGESWRSLPELNAGSIFGMAADPPRRLLWMASGSVEQTPSPENAFRGLIALDMDRLVAVHRISSVDDLGDVAVAADGTVFASAPATGAVYRLKPGRSSLEVLVHPGRMRSPQGLALSPDERQLYVADYRYGVAVIGLANAGIRRLDANGSMMLDGIDGLAADERGLIAIQNGVSPQRIVRLELDAQGTGVIRCEVLEQSHPEWGELTLAAVAGETLLYVADAQWGSFGSSGAVAEMAPRSTPIRMLPLRGGTLPPSAGSASATRCSSGSHEGASQPRRVSHRAAHRLIWDKIKGDHRSV